MVHVAYKVGYSMANNNNGNNGNGNNNTVGTITYRRAHPGGGPLGRCSYGVAGVPGIVVFDVGLFLPNTPPASIVLAHYNAQGQLVPLPLAVPQPRKVAAVTSAVVAQATQAVAQATGAPIAAPAQVAAQAAKVTGKAVAAATRKV
jgi:hypothetical protein